MKINKIIAASAITAGLIGATIAYLIVQPPASWDHTVGEFYFSLMTNTFAFYVHIGAAILFILSLTVYKQMMRTAFSGIVIGIVLIALGMFQLPVLDSLDAWNSFYTSSGIVALPFLIGGLAAYLGASTFGRLVGERGLLTNKLFALPASLLLAATSIFLPHVQTTVDELSYDISNIVVALTFILLAAAAIIIFRTSRKIGTHYTAALRWTGISLLLGSAAMFVAFVDVLISTATRDPLTVFLNVLTIVAGFTWLRAGYIFIKTKEY
jgi:hypothetical protein